MMAMTLRLMCVVLLARAALAAPSNMNKDDRESHFEILENKLASVVYPFESCDFLMVKYNLGHKGFLKTKGCF